MKAVSASESGIKMDLIAVTICVDLRRSIHLCSRCHGRTNSFVGFSPLSGLALILTNTWHGCRVVTDTTGRNVMADTSAEKSKILGTFLIRKTNVIVGQRNSSQGHLSVVIKFNNTSSQSITSAYDRRKSPEYFYD